MTIAEGKEMAKFARNLSFIFTPCVLVAAMVVSEIMDRLSPNIDPPMAAPTTRVVFRPPALASPSAIGVTAVTVPTEVPVDMEINADITKMPAAIF